MRQFRTIVSSISLIPMVFWTFSASADTAESDLATRCAADQGQAVISVLVENIRVLEGNVRAQVYSNNPDDFLGKGKKLVRIDTPVTAHEQILCVPMPAPGEYALVIMHDKNANGKADFFSEGFGFSRNPALNLAPPDHDEVVITAPEGISEQNVRLKYMFGSDDKKKEKRRRLKRR